jgi:hypothetical protein
MIRNDKLECHRAGSTASLKRAEESSRVVVYAMSSSFKPPLEDRRRSTPMLFRSSSS